MSKEEKNVNRRDFLFTASYTVGAVGLGAVIWPLIDQMNPDKAQQALATTEVDISQVEPGKSITVLWRGKPVFLKRRTPDEIAEARAVSMDDLGFSKIFRYEDYDNFLNKNKKKRIILMTTKAKKLYYKFKFKKNDILLFGRESAGVPDALHKTIKDKVKIPMNKNTRSLNVAMSVAIISAEALRQNNLLK